ncbi:MAG: trigger factor [Pyrinomonadaceae bacterium]
MSETIIKTELVDHSQVTKEIKIEIDAASVKKAYDVVSRRFASKVQVPGFRKGMAPVDVVRMRYRDEIRSDVLQEIVPKAIEEAIAQTGINPIADPDIHVDDLKTVKLNGSEPLKMHVHVEVMPEFDDPEYKGLEIKRRVRPVSDEEVEAVIEQRRKEHSSFVPSEGEKAGENDMVIVDLKGTFLDDENADPISVEDLEIELGDGNVEKTFSENLIGVVEEEEKEFTVTYPEDFSSNALAGRTVNYLAKVKSVGRIELPALDDEWVKSLNEGFESVNDLRKQLRTDFETVSKADADARVRSDLISKMVEAHQFEVPEALVKSQASSLLNNFAQELAERGVNLDTVGEDFVMTAYTQMREQATRDIRGALLLERIATIENLEVTETDIEEEISKMAEHYNATVEQIKSFLASRGEVASIENNLRTRKAVEVIFENAKISEGEWVDPNAAIDAGEDSDTASEEKKAPAKKAKATKKTEKSEEETEKPAKRASKKKAPESGE